MTTNCDECSCVGVVTLAFNTTMCVYRRCIRSRERIRVSGGLAYESMRHGKHSAQTSARNVIGPSKGTCCGIRAPRMTRFRDIAFEPGRIKCTFFFEFLFLCRYALTVRLKRFFHSFFSFAQPGKQRWSSTWLVCSEKSDRSETKTFVTRTGANAKSFVRHFVYFYATSLTRSRCFDYRSANDGFYYYSIIYLYLSHNFFGRACPT